MNPTQVRVCGNLEKTQVETEAADSRKRPPRKWRFWWTTYVTFKILEKLRKIHEELNK